MSQLYDALFGEATKEVHLISSPLERVIAQVRFPMILAISQDDEAAKFQERIRVKYPILESSSVQHVSVDAQTGVPSIATGKVWSFYDTEKLWRVSLTNDFIAIETKKYQSRKHFIEEIEFILDAFFKSYGAQVYTRLGIRYVNVIREPLVSGIGSILIPEVIGLHQQAIDDSIIHSITDTFIKAKEGTIRARWGSLSAGITIDPDAITPSLDAPYWVIDFDMFSEQVETFDVKGLTNSAQSYCERIYNLFRWATKEEFLTLHGGEKQ
jgi:uncharacterized protein (TIGR04255 family)